MTCIPCRNENEEGEIDEISFKWKDQSFPGEIASYSISGNTKNKKVTVSKKKERKKKEKKKKRKEEKRKKKEERKSVNDWELWNADINLEWKSRSIM